MSQRLELQTGAVVVKQDTTIKITNNDRLGKLGHQRSEAVLLFLDRGLGAGNLGIDIIHQHITLLSQVIGRTGQLLDLRRTIQRDAEISVGTQHQAQGFGHPQQAFNILFE